MKGKQRNKLPRTRAPITVKEARSSPRALAPKTVKVARSPNLDKSPPSSWPQQTFRHTTPRLLTLPPRLQFRHLKTCRSRRRALIRWLGNARHCAASDVVNEASQSCRNSVEHCGHLRLDTSTCFELCDGVLNKFMTESCHVLFFEIRQ